MLCLLMPILFLPESMNSLQILFPVNTAEFNKSTYYNNDFFIPTDEKWLRFKGEKSLIKIYLIISAKRLFKIERFAQDLLQIQDKKNVAKSNMDENSI